MGVRFRVLVTAFAGLLCLVAAPSLAVAGDGGVCATCQGGGGDKGDGGGADAGADGVYSLAELRALTREVGFAKPRVAAAIAMAESGGDPDVIAKNHKPRSFDRGLFQINSRYHPEVSDRCALKAGCNAREALRISDGGRHWHQWSTWHNEAYKAFL